MSANDSEEGDREQRPEGYCWARGVVHRIAEEYHQPRQRRIIDYWHRPTGEEVVEDMMEHGWDEEDAREAVRALWMDQMRSLDTENDRDGVRTDGGEPSATRRAASEASDGGVDSEGAGSERLNLMVEGETNDHSVREARYGDGEEPSSMYQRALGIAEVDGHIVRRTITYGKDEILCLDDHGELAVAGTDYTVVQSAGDYHCTCGEHFDGPEEAYEHLRSLHTESNA